MLSPVDPIHLLLEKHYQRLVAGQHIQFDEVQFNAVKHLQRVLEQLLFARQQRQQSSLRKWLSPAPVSFPSLYIFGDVGRGKSMLMALFFDACPIKEKRRVHFNAFMLEVHSFIHHYKQQNNKDALTALAEKISGSVCLLCFDEFHVTDIADAMILGRLFSKLFEANISIVMTSNRHPNELYQGGLQREQFLFFINVLRKSAEIVELAAQQDYRQAMLVVNRANYRFPLDASTDAFIRDSYQQLASHAAVATPVLEVFGRKLPVSAIADGVMRASFEELCGHPLGAADYLEIAKRFHVLILYGIPRMTAEKRNEAKRFVTLIDALYEHHVQLICSAEVAVAELYVEGDGAFEFRRTMSRLMEMQSQSYWAGSVVSALWV